MKNKYRVVEDDYLGFEAQVKYWYFPFKWYEISNHDTGVNTNTSIEEAEIIIDKHKKKLL